MCAGKGETRISAPTGYHPPTQCSFCSGRAAVRAQLVVSLVDLLTGRVVSRSIVPGALTPVRSPAGQAALDLGVVLRELTVALDVQNIYRVEASKMVPCDLGAPWLILLRYPAGAVMSEQWEYQYQGAAIAREAQHRPSLIFYTGVVEEPTPDADRMLNKLAQLADDLQLDLVIDVRVERSEMLSWTVRLDLPGAPLPTSRMGRSNTLHRALRETTVAKAMAGLRNRSNPAPARWLDPKASNWLTASEADEQDRPEQNQSLNWADLTAELTPKAIGSAGAIAVHRHGEWFFSALESAQDPENDSGRRLLPVTPLPDLPGELLPLAICPRCSGSATGKCYECAGSGQVRQGAVLTITDLESRTKHVNWYRLPEDQESRANRQRQTASGWPPRAAEVLLDPYYSVAEQAEPFGIPPHLLRDHFTGGVLDRLLADGILLNPDGEPPAARYLRRVARQRPGGRVIVLARPEPTPPTEWLFRAALGLGLEVVIAARAARPGGRPPAPAVTSWEVYLQPGTTSSGTTLPETASPGTTAETVTRRPVGLGRRFPSLAAAVAQLHDTFDDALAQALRVGPLEPVPVPQQAAVPQLDVLSIEPVLSGLAESFPDTNLQLSFDPGGCAITVGGRSSRAGTLQEVLAFLLPQLIEGEPDPEQLRQIVLMLLDENPQLERLEMLDGDLRGRFHFSLALGGLLKCFVRERFGSEPERAALENFAARTYQEALKLPIEDDESRPAQTVYRQLLTALTDSAGPNEQASTAWRQIQLMDQLSAVLDVLGHLIRERRQTGAVTSELDDLLVGQAVDTGLRLARTLTASADSKR
jgi:hypothetical protein